MARTALLYPMATMVAYTWLFVLYNLFVRVQAVRRRDVNIRHFKTYAVGQAPERVVVAGRHLDNLFQLPVVFLATGATAVGLDLVNPVLMGYAWAFIVARAAQSLVHLTFNHPLTRAGAYAAAWLCVGVMWIELLRQVA